MAINVTAVEKMKPWQVKDFIKNMYKAAAGVATGELKILEAKEKARRLSICEACPNFNKVAYQCRICSCRGRMLELKASINLWKCPEGRWEHTPKLIPVKGYCRSCKGAVVKIVTKDDKTLEQCENGCIINTSGS